MNEYVTNSYFHSNTAPHMNLNASCVMIHLEIAWDKYQEAVRVNKLMDNRHIDQGNLCQAHRGLNLVESTCGL